jgi:hypothetical protein
MAGVAISLLSALLYIAILVVVAWALVSLFKVMGINPKAMQIVSIVLWAVVAVVCLLILISAISGSLVPVTGIG